MQIRRATREDLGPVASLLRASNRPPLSSELPLANVLVALEDGEVVGAIALEVHGLQGIVWPSAVDAARAGEDVRSSLLQTLLSRAYELSLRNLYLATDREVDAFRDAGFAPIADEAVPMEIRRSRTFRNQRSDDTRAMRLRLASRVV